MEAQSINIFRIFDPEGLDESRDSNPDLSLPIVVEKTGGGSYELIDGSHRLYEQLDSGKTSIQAYVVKNKSRWLSCDWGVAIAESHGKTPAPHDAAECSRSNVEAIKRHF